MGLFTPRESGNPNNQALVWLDPNDYTESIVRDAATGDPISSSPSTWNVVVTKELKEWRGINLTVTVKNVSQLQQSAPFIRMVSGMYHPSWTGAGGSSRLRHAINYMSHDSYGMRPVAYSYPVPSNPATDKFGDPNAIYGVNWFAPCFTIENSTPSLPFYGCQMMSVSTNYNYPFRIYVDFDPTTFKGYFRMEGNVNIPGKGILDKIEPGETRTWKIWLRFENYFTSTQNNFYHSKSYRKIAALRSYEPYFVWYWENHSDYNVGPRVSGRVYGVELAGANAPRAYFSARDNPRRYFLFSTQDKKSLEGRLPLPGQQYVNPQTVSGWEELLDGMVDVTTLKTYGYQAVLVLNPAGWGNADQGGNPAFFTNLPLNLRNTLAEIKQWEEDNQLRVFFASSNTLNKVNLGTYSDPAVAFDQTNPLHQQFETDNFIEGGLRSVSGLTLFDLPQPISDSLLESYIGGWRAAFPSVSMASGHRIENDAYNYVVPAYYDRSEFLTADYSKGGRDWFLDMLLTGLDPWVYMPINSWYADYGTSISTESAYDNYVQKIEKDHQAIPVTIGRIVRRDCLLPPKISWKESYTSYSSIIASGPSSVCFLGDPVLGGRKVCTTRDLHHYYSSNVPASLNTNMLGYYQFPGFYDWNAQHCWIPCMGGSGDIISKSGDALLWLYQEDKLTKAKQTIIDNVNGVNNNQPKLIPEGYVGDFWINWEPALYRDGSSTSAIGIGIGDNLEFYLEQSQSALIRSSPGSNLAPRTARDWWIWVQDQVNPGWSSGKTLAQQNEYLQSEWVRKWVQWMTELLNTFRTQRPGLGKIGLYGSVPQKGVWAIHGQNYGTTDPDIEDPYRELENSHWHDWANLFEYMAQSMYLWDPVVDYDAPFMYDTTERRAKDPIQTRMFYILSARNFQDVARRAGNKEFVPFLWHSHLRSPTYVNPNIGSFLYKSIYLMGGHGSIWWDALSSRASVLTSLGYVEQHWYPVANFIAGRIAAYNIDVDPPAPLQGGTGGSGGSSGSGGTVTGEENETFLAKFGKIRVTSLGGKTQRDQIPGFGVSRYKNTPSGAVGDLFPEDYSSFSVIAIANSIDGTLELSKAIGKYNKIELSIVDPALTNVGMPHWVLEDTFEWINSGIPSHLSQVHHSNILSGGIGVERVTPGLIDSTAPLFQAKCIVPCNSNWYDKTKSTVDYDLSFDHGTTNLSLPYANCVLSIPELGTVWVGGFGGVLLINTVTKDIAKLAIDSDRTLLIKSIRRYRDTIYILDEAKLYFYDISTRQVIADTATGLPKKLYSMASIFGSNLVIGAEDGIYARKIGSLTWEKVVSTSSTVNIMASPDAVLAVSDTGESYYSTDGFNWTRVGIVNDKIVNKIQKHRSQILFATTKGLFQDGGTFYTKNLSLQLLDVLDDAQRSSEISVNDIDSDFTKAVIGLSDGRYLVYADDFVVHTDSKLDSIHKVLILGDDIWLFGYNQYRIVSEESIRKLATGYPIR